MGMLLAATTMQVISVNINRRMMEAVAQAAIGMM
jgi:hypothetical protein